MKLDFHADQEPEMSFEALPADNYVCAIVESAEKPTKAGDGKYLELKYEILDGPFKGRSLWDRLCLEHPVKLTVQTARSRLAQICKAVGVLSPKDSIDLHNLPLIVRVAQKQREDNGEMGNEIKGYKPRNAVTTEATTPESAPWKKA